MSDSDLRWSSVFEDDNMVTVAVEVADELVSLGRQVPILRQLEAIFAHPVLEERPKSQRLEVYLSSGASAGGWDAATLSDLDINFTCQVASTRVSAGRQFE